MPAGSETLEILIRTRGGKQAAGDLQLVASKTDGVTGSTRRASGAQKDAATSGSRLAGSWKGMIGRAAVLAGKVAALGIAFFGLKALKDSVSTTADFAKATMGLHKNLNLSIEDSSAWVAVAKTRGVETKALNMSFGTLSKNIDASTKGGKAQAEAFARLGVSWQTRKAGDFNTILGEVADGFKKMGPGPERTAMSMKLFGRGWQTIVPLLREGKVGMEDALALADKYGATLKGKTTKEVMELVQAEREAKFATLGLSLTFGTTLAPMLTTAMQKFNEMVIAIRSGDGVWGTLAERIKDTVKIGKDAVGWLGKHKTALYVLLGALAVVAVGLTTYSLAVWVASVAIRVWAVATGIATAAQWLFGGSLLGTRIALVALAIQTKLAAAGMWLFNAAMAANPLVLLTLAVLGTVVGMYLLYTRVKAVRDFIATYWPLLVGIFLLPLGPLRILISVFGLVRQHGGGAFNWVKTAAQNAWNTLKGIASWVAGAGSTMWNGIKSGFSAVYNFIADKIQWIVDKINDLKAALDSVNPFGGGGGGEGLQVAPELLERARGGPVMAGKSYLVGETGPELFRADTAGEIVPLESAAGPGLVGGGGGVREIVRLITVDNRVLAEAVFDAAATAEARA